MRRYLAAKKISIVGFISAKKMHYGIDEILCLRNPYANFYIITRGIQMITSKA